MDEPSALWIEGIGDFPVDELDNSIRYLYQNLPEEIGGTRYLQDWPLIIY